MTPTDRLEKPVEGAGMDDIGAMALALPERDRSRADGQTWQQRKSIQTRVAILEAAIDCLRAHGYGRTTTQLIAEMAQISRGAMLHHYATKHELMASVGSYTLYRRMEAFLVGVRALKETDRIAEMAGIEIFWESLKTREFGAYLELIIAARSDTKLAEVFVPKVRMYDKVELEQVVRAFPEWTDHPAGYALAMDYCNAALQGLWINADVWNEDDQVRLRRFVGKTIRMLLAGALSMPPSGILAGGDRE